MLCRAAILHADVISRREGGARAFAVASSWDLFADIPSWGNCSGILSVQFIGWTKVNLETVAV